MPRPRRFGKTLNLSMLRYFFEKNEAPRRDLFRGLAIRKTSLFDQHQGNIRSSI
ncbi:MAG: AAA family ATPase [Chloroflexi bacterium]|nr:AAA family ATPase [Chloroflexota bacterium]